VLRPPWRLTAIVVALATGAIGYAVVPARPAADAATTPSTHGAAVHHRTVHHAVRQARSRPRVVTVSVGLNGSFTGYRNPNVTLRHDQKLEIVNHDRMTHTITSVATDANGNHLFDTSANPGKRVVVANANKLVAGKYKFYCRIHPSMRGTLTVKGRGGTIKAAEQAFNQPLKLPKVLTGSDLTVPIEKSQVQVLPHGPKTSMWTYGGSYPGPTIRRTAGQDTRVTFVDDLPAADGKFTVHLHGDHHSSADDGQPTTELIGAGHSKTYDYPLTDAGAPERAAIDFYHDHRMGTTSRNIWMGLQGMFLVDPGPGESNFNLPSGKYDVPLMVSDRSFDKNNQLTFPFKPNGMPKQSGTVGDKVLVDGRYAPYLKVAAHQYRLRLLNTSNFSTYNFALSDHQKFVQVGTGSGLLPHPVKRSSILLGPAQRADVVVDFRGELNKNVVLESVPRTDSRPKGSADSPQLPIMQFKVRTKASGGSTVPADLEQPPPIGPATPNHPDFTWRLGGSGMRWTINGHTYDPTVYQHAVPLGATETWKIANDTKMTHYVHLHEEQWHTIEFIKANGTTFLPAWEKGLEDTWLLDPGESVVVEATFTDYTGPFMIHCHMLDHEDEGMMAQFVVLDPEGKAPPGMHLASSVHAAGTVAMAGMNMPAASSVPVSVRPSAPAAAAFWPRALRRAGVALAVELAALALLCLLLGYRRRFDAFATGARNTH
jgi:spore coat protein A, manganese oxidase